MPPLRQTRVAPRVAELAAAIVSQPLPLYHGAKTCQRSGYCCEQAPCPFGSWDTAARRCTELAYDDAGLAVCRRYDEILAMPQAVWWLAPAFGAGCCSPLNPKRTRLSHNHTET